MYHPGIIIHGFSPNGLQLQGLTPWSPFPSAPDILKDPPPETSNFSPNWTHQMGCVCVYDFFVKPKKNLENCKGKFFRVGRNLKLFESLFRLEELMMNVLRSNESNAQFFAVDFLSLHIFEINHARNTNQAPKV